MSFNGIYLWHSEDGMPTSYDDARRILATFEDKDIVITEAQNARFMAVAKAIEDFAKQALEYYDGEELDIYSRMTQWMTGFKRPVLSLSHNPEEVQQAFSGVLVDAAQKNNLIVLHQQIEVAFLPDGSVLTNNDPDIWYDFDNLELKAWQEKRQSLQASLDTDKAPEHLPETTALAKRFVNRIVQERLKQAGIKAKKTSTTGYIVDKEGYTIELNITPEYDWLYNYEEDKIRIINLDSVTIKVPELRECLNSSYLFTNSIAYYKKDRIIHTDEDGKPTHVVRKEEVNGFYSVDAYTAYIHQCADMFIDIVSQAGKGISGLYWYLEQNQHSEQLRFHEKYPECSGFMPKPLAILALAKLSNQPNMAALVERYRQAYIDHELLYEQKVHEEDLYDLELGLIHEKQVRPLAPEAERIQAHANEADLWINDIMNLPSQEG